MFNNGLKKVVADLAEQVQQLAANADGHFGQHGLKSSNLSLDHEEHHYFSLAATTIPYYHLIVDCLNMLGPSPFPHAPSLPLEKVALALDSSTSLCIPLLVLNKGIEGRGGAREGQGRGGGCGQGITHDWLLIAKMPPQVLWSWSSHFSASPLCLYSPYSRGCFNQRKRTRIMGEHQCLCHPSLYRCVQSALSLKSPLPPNSTTNAFSSAPPGRSSWPVCSYLAVSFSAWTSWSSLTSSRRCAGK